MGVVPFERFGWLQQLSERHHGSRHAKRVGHLVYQAEPGAYISDVSGCGEVRDSPYILPAWLDGGGRNLESRKLRVLGKAELVRVEGDAVSPTYVESFHGLCIGASYVLGPQQGVVYALGFCEDVGHDGVITAGIAIS